MCESKQETPVAAMLHKNIPIDSMRKVFSELELLCLFIEDLRDGVMQRRMKVIRGLMRW